MFLVRKAGIFGDFIVLVEQVVQHGPGSPESASPVVKYVGKASASRQACALRCMSDDTTKNIVLVTAVFFWWMGLPLS